MKSADSMLRRSLQYFTNLHRSLLDLMQRLSADDMERPTVKKNKLYDLSCFNILPPDQDFFLNLMDIAVENTEKTDALRPCIILSKFGQKQRSPLNLSDVCVLSKVTCISIHTGCEIQSAHNNTHHFWSNYALQDLVGRRGQLYPALSLREAVNFASNLDGKEMDIQPDLANIAKFPPQQITFLQLYAVTPHNRMDNWFPHPVSGEIVCCGIMHPKTASAMSRHSKQYLSHMKDHVNKMLAVVTARVEIVTLVEVDQIKETVNGSDFFAIDRLKKLIEESALLLPFAEAQAGGTFTGIMKEVATHLCDILEQSYSTGRCKGTFTESWAAFQAEIALEVLFWGHPCSMHDSLYQNGLGLSTNSEWSLTWERGILGLAHYSAAAVEGSPPPLLYWTTDNKQMARIHRLFGFADSVGTALPIVGSNLLKIILCDLFESNYISLDAFSKDMPPHGRCTGTITQEQLILELQKIKRFTYPATYSRAVAILEMAGKSLKDVLGSALHSVNMKYFPAMRFTDSSHHAKASWNKKDFWCILSPQQKATPEIDAQIWEGDVAIALVSRGLTFERNLKTARENGMPWMKQVVLRLQGEKQLTREQLLNVLVFISAVACMQQGIYVDYEKLAKIEYDLPIDQRKLQSLQIQSNIMFPRLKKPRIWTLHKGIPYKLKETPKLQQPVNQIIWHDDGARQEETELPQDAEQEEQMILPNRSMVLPAGWHRRWSSQELGLAHEAAMRINQAPVKAYRLYVDMCFRENIPARTLEAFKSKVVKGQKRKREINTC